MVFVLFSNCVGLCLACRVLSFCREQRLVAWAALQYGEREGGKESKIYTSSPEPRRYIDPRSELGVSKETLAGGLSIHGPIDRPISWLYFVSHYSAKAGTLARYCSDFVVVAIDNDW